MTEPNISITWFVVLVVVIAAIQLSVARCLRLWFDRREARRPARMSLDETSVSQIVARLQAVAGNMAANAGGHCSEIAAQSQELKSTVADSPDAVRDAVFKVADQIVQSNEQLQAKLKTAIQRLEDQADYIRSQSNEARTDALTGLANRRAFDETITRRFSEWERTGTPLSLIMLDLDHFKLCNDTYGHQAGDAVLRLVATTLLENVREMDVVARFGGEELAVILPTAKLDQALKLAERIRTNIEQKRCRFEEHKIRVTASLGVAEARRGEDGLKFVGRADTAMYAAKQGGRNRTYHHDGTSCRRNEADPQGDAPKKTAAAEWSEIRNDLRRCLRQLAGEKES